MFRNYAKFFKFFHLFQKYEYYQKFLKNSRNFGKFLEIFGDFWKCSEITRNFSSFFIFFKFTNFSVWNFQKQKCTWMHNIFCCTMKKLDLKFHGLARKKWGILSEILGFHGFSHENTVFSRYVKLKCMEKFSFSCKVRTKALRFR